MSTARLVAAILLGRKDHVSMMEGMAMGREVKVLAADPRARLAAFQEIVGLCANDPTLAGVITRTARTIHEASRPAKANAGG